MTVPSVAERCAPSRVAREVPATLYRVAVRLTILGGGGFRVPLIYRALSRREQSRRAGIGIDEVVLQDADPRRLAVIAAVLAGEHGPRIRLAGSVAEAVAGADVVFSAIRVGGAVGRVRDERRALDLGVLGQETVGAGGLAYALRTLPVALEAARIIHEVAPDAWLVNFTNPAGLVTEALRTVLGDRVIGICDSPIGLIRRARRAAGLPADHTGRIDYVGINHLGWLRSLSDGEKDLLPGLLSDDSALQTIEEGRLFGGPLLRALACLPNEYAYFYYAATDLVRTLTDGRTRGEVVAQDQEVFYAAATADPPNASELWMRTRQRREESYLAETRSAAEQRDAEDLTGGGYEHVALDLIEALLTGRPTELIVNAPNGSAVPQLPPDMVIEVPCVVDGLGARPLPVAPLDLHQLGLIASVRASERAVIAAVLNRSRNDALRAFVIHPLVGSPVIAAGLLAALLAEDPVLDQLLGEH
jgi:6-phospho-beta-glucosidase